MQLNLDTTHKYQFDLFDYLYLLSKGLKANE